jgi:hypothetical protein
MGHLRSHRGIYLRRYLMEQLVHYILRTTSVWSYGQRRSPYLPCLSCQASSRLQMSPGASPSAALCLVTSQTSSIALHGPTRSHRELERRPWQNKLGPLSWQQRGHGWPGDRDSWHQEAWVGVVLCLGVPNGRCREPTRLAMSWGTVQTSSPFRDTR